MTAGTIVILIVLALGIGLNLVKNRESKGKYDFWASLITMGVWLLLLWWAGNFG